MSKRALANGASLIQFDGEPQRSVAWAQNFVVEWVAGAAEERSLSSGEEIIGVLWCGVATIGGSAGSHSIAAPAVVILPPGNYHVSTSEDSGMVLLATSRPDLTAEAPDERSYNEKIAPVGEPFRRTRVLSGIEVLAFSDIPTPPTNGRIRFIQSETMSINLVVYGGPRGATALSPHAHADIEQGTLAITGDYVHHLRTPWGPDATQWQEDVHLPAPPASLLLIPPELIHTTEGTGEGQHLLLDIFAPPRRDFIAKQWIANAGDYLDPGTRQEKDVA